MVNTYVIKNVTLPLGVLCRGGGNTTGMSKPHLGCWKKNGIYKDSNIWAESSKEPVEERTPSVYSSSILLDLDFYLGVR